MPKISQADINKKLTRLAHTWCRIRTCKKCLLPYNQGYVCECGHDNTYEYCHDCEVEYNKWDDEIKEYNRHFCIKFKTIT